MTDPFDLPIDLFDELVMRCEEVRRWEAGDDDGGAASLMAEAMRKVGAR